MNGGSDNQRDVASKNAISLISRSSLKLSGIIIMFFFIFGVHYGSVGLRGMFPDMLISVWLQELFEESEWWWDYMITVGVPFLVVFALAAVWKHLEGKNSLTYFIVSSLLYGSIIGYSIVGMLVVPFLLRGVKSDPNGFIGIWLQGIYDASVFQYYLFTVGVPIAVVVVLMLVRVWFGVGIAEWSKTNFGRESRQ